MSNFAVALKASVLVILTLACCALAPPPRDVNVIGPPGSIVFERSASGVALATASSPNPANSVAASSAPNSTPVPQKTSAADVSWTAAEWSRFLVVFLSFAFAGIGAVAVNWAAGRNPALSRGADRTGTFTADKILEASRISFGFQLIVAGMILAFLVAVVTLALADPMAPIGNVVAVISTVNGSVTVTSPQGKGRVDVTLVFPNPTPNKIIGTFEYLADSASPGAGPVVASITPTGGRSAGGDPVTITGSGFTGATSVNFGSTPSTAVTVASDTLITATSPAGSGTVDVVVVTPAATSATTTADQFTYG